MFRIAKFCYETPHPNGLDNFTCDIDFRCDFADNIAEAEKLERSLEAASSCNRSLGTGMFVDLYESLGDAAFRRGFRNLYLALRDEAHESVCAGEYRNGCYLREAFADGATPEQLAIIDEIVARRYYGRGLE